MRRHTYTDKQVEQIAQIVFEWMREHDCYSGEHAAQCDACNIDAIDLICDLADVKNVTDYDFD